MKKKEKYQVKHVEDESGNTTDKILAISLKNLLFQVYKIVPNAGNSIELELNIEDIVGFLTNYTDVVLEITCKENLDKPKQYIFTSKSDMDKFVKMFAKAKVLAENTQRQLRYCKHVPKSPWLKECTIEDQKIISQYQKKATCYKAVITGIGLSQYKYLVIPFNEQKLIMISKQGIIEETINFTDIISISLKYSSFIPILMQCKRSKFVQILEIVLPSLKDCLWLRSLIYQYKTPHFILSPINDKSMKICKIPIYLLTFNMNRQTLQVQLETLFSKAKSAKIAIICFQEIPLLKRSQTLKAVETYFDSQGMILTVSHVMWEMALFVFCQKELNTFITRIEKKELTAGFLNIVGNKGGLLISFEIMETRIAIAGVHLRHGQKHVKDRNSTLWKIFKSLRFGHEAIESHLQADHCFFLGDTNYRIDHSRPALLKELEKNNIEYLVKLDQLQSEKQAGKILSGFNVFS